MTENKPLLPEKAELEKALLSMQSSKGEESVRTTFKLSRATMDTLGFFKENGVPIKGFFRDMCSELAETHEEDSFLHRSLRRAKKGAVETSRSAVRKTLVISQASLNKFNELSRKYKIARDALVEAAVTEYLLLTARRLEVMIENDKKALEIVEKLESQMLSAEKELAGLFGDDAPIMTRFGKVIIVLQNLFFAIKDELEDGTPIDPEGI